MSYILPPLPYAYNALEPYISSETLHYHYDKHHTAYLNKLNELRHNDSSLSLEELILTSTGAVFNQAAQVWNHSFYWSCMSAQHHQKPSEALVTALEEHFHSVDIFIEKMSTAALSQFGSGWAWLVYADNTLQIVTSSNAETPLQNGQKPLLVIDIWEHAYYIDTRNDRSQYVKNFWSVVNWAFVTHNYQTACLNNNQ